MSIGAIPRHRPRQILPDPCISRRTSLSLTDQEILGFGKVADLANGHAYHDLPPALLSAITELPTLWRDASRLSPLDWERGYRAAFARLAGLPGLTALRFCRPCPTASNSIDLVSALLRQQNRRTLLVQPTFDNLALLLRRRGVAVEPIAESVLFDISAHDALDRILLGQGAAALFLVSPTNPTGRCMDAATLAALAALCARRQILLVIDACFRLFDRNPIDDLAILQASGVSFLVFEDTGKCFPTLDTKASLIYGSDDIAADLEAIYNEVYLCCSGLSLAFLTRLFELTSAAGLHSTLWSFVDQRRMRLRAALVGTGLTPAPESFHSVIGLEWLDCRPAGMSDVDACESLGRLGIAAVTGRQFFWADPDAPLHQHRLRLSMMKTRRCFDGGLLLLERLRDAGGLGALASGNDVAFRATQFSAPAEDDPIRLRAVRSASA